MLDYWSDIYHRMGDIHNASLFLFRTHFYGEGNRKLMRSIDEHKRIKKKSSGMTAKTDSGDL